MSRALPIQFDHDRLVALCRELEVERLAFFGSVVRDDFGPESDVDVLVEFAPDARAGLMRLARLQLALSDLIGRDVQVTTPKSLNRHFRDEVVESAVRVYDAA